MTINTDNRQAGPFVGNNAATQFAFNFKIFAAEELLVIKTITATNDNVSMVLNSDYTAVLSDDQNASPGGYITLSLPLAVGFRMIITSNVDNTQKTDLTNQGGFFPEVITNALDKLTILIQQLQQFYLRTISLPLTAGTNVSVVFPSPKAQNIIGWDEFGTALKDYAPADFAALINPALAPFSPLANYAALAATAPYALGQVVKIKCHTSGIIGGGDFIAVSSTGLTTDGGTISASATVGVYWQRINYTDLDAAFFGVLSNGVDQTSKLVTLFTTLAANSYRGVLRIQYNTKFTTSTVYAAVYPGLILEDNSSINFGQPPGYKNKFIMTYTGDTVSDDSQIITASGHHPTINLLNFGTAGSASAINYYASRLVSVGIKSNGDLIDTIQHLHLKSPRGAMWRDSTVVLTDYPAATSKQWITATPFTALSYCYNGANYYQTTAGGTTGATPPTHTSGSISDGSVTWTYAGPYVSGSTLSYSDSDGVHGFQSPNAAVQVNFDALTNGFYLSYNLASDLSTNEIGWYDKFRSYDIVRSSSSRGIHIGGPASIKFTTVTGAIPAASTEGLYVNNPGAVNMTGMTSPGTMANQIVTLQFANGNTKLVHSSTFNLKNAIDVTPISGQIVTMMKNAAHSSGWFEYSRSF